MRRLLIVLPALFVLLPAGWGLAAAGAAQGAAATVPVSASVPDGDAAARHARRTACLKEAKARKLIGAKKAAFLKDCLAAP
jgi:hypothetical protein